MDEDEGSSRVQFGEVEDIRHMLQDMETLRNSRNEDINRDRVDMKHRKQEQLNTGNKRNTTQFFQLNEKLSEI